MHDVVRVQVVQAAEGLSQHPLQAVFRVELFPCAHGTDKGRDCTVHELNKNPEDAPGVVVGIYHVQAEAVLSRAHLHQRHLVIHQLLVLLSARGAELQGKLRLVRLALDPEHLSEAADAQFFLAEHIIKG